MNDSHDLIEQPTDRAPEPAGRTLSVIEAAIRSGANADQLERLLELQVRADNHQLAMMREKRSMDEEDRKTAAVLAYRRDFAGFRGENVIIPKSKFVDRGRAGSFWQADFARVADLLSPKLEAHGFGFRHDQVFGAKPWKTDGVESDIPWVYVTCFLEHKDGHSEHLSLEGPPGDLSANTPVQNMQATASYLKRQSLLAITGTATADEDDENKLRGAKGDTNDDDDAIINAGRAAAMEGMEALTAWWGCLTAKQRGAYQKDFGGLRKAAALADQEAKHD